MMMRLELHRKINLCLLFVLKLKAHIFYCPFMTNEKNMCWLLSVGVVVDVGGVGVGVLCCHVSPLALSDPDPTILQCRDCNAIYNV